eukprot:767704-Hanusia_phi.AAC.11
MHKDDLKDLYERKLAVVRSLTPREQYGQFLNIVSGKPTPPSGLAHLCQHGEMGRGSRNREKTTSD